MFHFGVWAVGFAAANADSDVFVTEDALSLIQLKTHHKNMQGPETAGEQFISLISKDKQGPEYAFQRNVCGCDCLEGVTGCCLALAGDNDEWKPFCGMPSDFLHIECQMLGHAPVSGRFCAGTDEAAAEGDPHITTNTGKHFDLSLISQDEQGKYLSMISQDRQGPEYLFQRNVCGCDCLEGVTGCCLALAGDNDEWKPFCGMPSDFLHIECQMLGHAPVSGRFCAGKDEAAAEGDPHITTNTGKHFDLSLISQDEQGKYLSLISQDKQG